MTPPCNVPTLPAPSAHEVIQDTREWLEKAVIGLNLCPFAKAVHVRGQIRYVVSGARTGSALLQELAAELRTLQATAPELVDTTLLIHPHVLQDFAAFNDFLGRADAALVAAGLVGEIQIASFHPGYQFAGTAPDAISNHTNRSPHPTLHLLREASISRAVQAFPAAETIYQANLATLEKLGHAGWEKLGLKKSPACDIAP